MMQEVCYISCRLDCLSVCLSVPSQCSIKMAFSKVIRQIEYTVQKEAKEITGRYKQTAVGSKLRHGFATDLAYTVKRNIKPRLLITACPVMQPVVKANNLKVMGTDKFRPKCVRLHLFRQSFIDMGVNREGGRVLPRTWYAGEANAKLPLPQNLSWFKI